MLDNQGNISKTLEALSNSNSVKSLVTAMVIGGALSGFDSVMGFDKAAGGAAATNAGNAKLPLLSNGDWSKIAQRVAGQSIISSSLNTTINGGSFKDNFTTALLANIGNRFQAEGAFLIGENGDILGLPGRTVSHAVIAGVAAEIGGGDGKGAAAGAMAAELAGVIMQSSLFEPANLNEKERQLYRLQEALTGSEAKTQAAKVVAAIAGAVTTHTPEGAYSGANAGEQVYRYNFDEHLLDSVLTEANNDIALAKQGDLAAIQRVQARNDALSAVAIIGAGGVAVAAGGVWLVATAPELALAARLALTGCKTQPMLCFNQAGIFATDLAAPEAALGVGAAVSGTTFVLGKTEDSAKRLSQQLANTAQAFYNKQGIKTQPVADFIKGEVTVGSSLSTKTADYLREIQKANTEQVIKVFDKAQPDSKLNVFGKQIEQVLGEGGSNTSGTTKVFASPSLSEQEIRNFAQSLAGNVPLQERNMPQGIIYIAQLNDGSTIKLRNFSKSSEDTKARWTIEITGNESINSLQGKVKKKIELKFQ
ncbi:DUF637 domain-containing protein [Candidatus Symbiopectobacterium sp. NZEC135]|uniref:DUF637 domain-containing protein n=1 Tax=Candidatus Symbiopectobacterium sp. NZEC135 TaxID=2820471 RepID=UPI0029CAB08B|nr:DUF637 domain-containing protein [Candidatus Symbiopectobacterium sp. NZEC135]MCW2479275.1 DUF637 domain-containing protein [Candidatus Symbiopectobacterium sp. NZEC135]